MIWCVGFTLDYGVISLPVFEPDGYPRHDRGISTLPGLYFLGLPWLYTWGSGRFCGVGRDAEHLAEHIQRARMAIGRSNELTKQN